MLSPKKIWEVIRWNCKKRLPSLDPPHIWEQNSADNHCRRSPPSSKKLRESACRSNVVAKNSNKRPTLGPSFGQPRPLSPTLTIPFDSPQHREQIPIEFHSWRTSPAWENSLKEARWSKAIIAFGQLFELRAADHRYSRTRNHFQWSLSSLDTKKNQVPP